MNSEFVDEFEIKTEIEEWKPPDVSEFGIITSRDQNQSPDSHLNEIKKSNNFFDISKGPKIKLEGTFVVITQYFRH